MVEAAALDAPFLGSAKPMRRGITNAEQQGPALCLEQAVPPSPALSSPTEGQVWSTAGGERVRRVELLSRVLLPLESCPWLPRGLVSSPAWFLGGQRPGPMAPRELRIGQLLKPGLPDGLFSLQTKMQEQ